MSIKHKSSSKDVIEILRGPLVRNQLQHYSLKYLLRTEDIFFQPIQEQGEQVETER